MQTNGHFTAASTAAHTPLSCVANPAPEPDSEGAFSFNGVVNEYDFEAGNLYRLQHGHQLAFRDLVQ
jgi:hypothetical protein